MGFFFKTAKPKFNLFDFLTEYQWEVGLAAGLILILALLLCRCVSSDKREPDEPMEELILPPFESDSEEEDDEEIITPRRSARLRNKRLSMTI